MDYKWIWKFLKYFENNIFEVLYDEDKNDWSDIQLPSDDEIVIPPPLYSGKKLDDIAQYICDKYVSNEKLPDNHKMCYLDEIVNTIVSAVNEQMKGNKHMDIGKMSDVLPYMMPCLRKMVCQYLTPHPSSTGSSKNRTQPKQLERTFRLLGCETIHSEVEVLRRMMPTPVEKTFYSAFRTLLSEYGQMTNKYPNFSKVKFTYNGEVHTINTEDNLKGERDRELYYACYKQCKDVCRQSILQALLIVSTSRDDYLKYYNPIS